MKKILTFFLFFILTLFLGLTAKPVNAMLQDGGGGGGGSDAYVASVPFKNDNTYINWQVHAIYKGCVSTLSGGVNCINQDAKNFYVYHQDYILVYFAVSGQPTTDDKIKWWTSCVDPTQQLWTANNQVTCDYNGNCHGVGSTTYYKNTIDITCKTGHSGDYSSIYDGCGFPNLNLGGSNNFVAINDICPVNTSGDCIKGGVQIKCNDNACNASCQRYSCDYSNSASNWCVTTRDTTCSGCGVVYKPDLIVSQFAYTGGTAGGTTDPTIVIKNQGNTTVTGTFSVRINNGGGTSRTTSVTANIGANGSLNLTNNPTYPEFQNMPLPSAGNYTATATVDSGDTINESNENNNTKTDAYTTTSNATKDLIVSQFVYPGGTPGRTVDPTIAIVNQGNTAVTENFKVKINNGAGTTATTTVYATIGANGGSLNLTNDPTYPEFQNMPLPPAGNYTATATVDSSDLVNESNENNNTKTDNYVTNTTCTRNAPSITVSPTARSGLPGTTKTYAVTVTNNDSVGCSRTDFTNTLTFAAADATQWHNPSVPANSRTRWYDTGDTITNSYTSRTVSNIFHNLAPNASEPQTLDVSFKTTATAELKTMTITTQNNASNQTASRNITFDLRQGITVNVYDDPNGDSASTTLYTNALPTFTNTASFTLGGTSYTIPAAAGTYTVANAAAGNVNLNPPSGHRLSATDTNPKAAAPGDTVNFYIQANPPTCTLSASPNSGNVPPGFTSTLTANCTAPAGQTLTYNWVEDPAAWGGTIANKGTNHTSTAQWTSPNSVTQNRTANPSVSGCSVQTSVCDIATTSILIRPSYSISGNVFEDTNPENHKKDIGEVNFQSSFTMTRNGTPITTYADGRSPNYIANQLPAGTYTIALARPQGVTMTWPQNAPPSFSVTIPCTGPVTGSPDSQCTAGESVTDLNFGVSNSSPWIQSGGSDMWFNKGLSYSIPSSPTCGSGAYMSIPKIANGTTPGVISSGLGAANFGDSGGSASLQKWQIGGASSPLSENFSSSSTGGGSKISYNYVMSVANQSGRTIANRGIVNLATITGCSDLNSCSLPSSLASFPENVYYTSGDLTISSDTTFPAGTVANPANYIILVNGKLTIKGKIQVPVNSTLLFATTNDIVVDPSVGSSAATYPNYPSGATHADLEGWYVTNTNFIVEGNHTCNTTADLRLNAAGAILTDADFNGGGTFQNNRDLCSGNSACPVFYVEERPDFIINAPELIQFSPRIWQEVAP